MKDFLKYIKLAYCNVRPVKSSEYVYSLAVFIHRVFPCDTVLSPFGVGMSVTPKNVSPELKHTPTRSPVCGGAS